jgi:multidrug resistance efflux pump
MKPTTSTLLISLCLALLATSCAGRPSLPVNPDAVGQALDQLVQRGQATADGPLAATGIVEAERVAVASETGGRVVALSVAEGDQVTAGQQVLSLDDSLIQAGLAQVDAAVAVAEARLQQLEAGARPEQVAHARSLVAQAEVAAAVAQQAWDDAALLRDTPQELDGQIVEAETALARAEPQARAARLLAEGADLKTALWGRVTQLLQEGFDVSLPWGETLHIDKPAERDQANQQWNLSGQEAWEAWQSAYAAEDAVAAAQTALADLRRQRANPIAMDMQVNQAGAAYRRAEAAVAQAEAGLAAVQEGARPEQLAVARQAVAQARAARSSLEVQLAQASVAAPADGLVTQVAVRQGEVAAPGAAVLELADLAEATLTVYVPQPDLGQVQLGQAVSITVDSFPGRQFTGVVTRISDQAEFTPKSVQTPEERVNTVFAVEITVPNPDAALKPGMPADAVFGPAGNTAPAAAAAPIVPRPELLPSLPSARPQATAPIAASGTVEAEETTVAAELSARVLQVLAGEGDTVAAGEELVHLDDRLLQADLQEAEQAVVTAEATLTLAEAGPRAAQIAAAEAGLAGATALRDGARQALADATAAREDQLALDAQINAVQSRVALAQRQVEMQQARQRYVAVLRENIAGDGSDQGKTQRAIYEKQEAAAGESIAAAAEEVRGAGRLLAHLRQVRQNPVGLDAQVRAAAGQVQLAEVGVQVAEAALALANAAPRPEDVALAEAELALARAGRDLVQAQAARYAITSPVAGTVTTRAINPGEVALPAAPLLKVAALDRLTLVIYVPETRIGQVEVGQPATVRVDAYPGQDFPGTVTYISPRAEFTPKNIQTAEERVQTVFAVKITLDNPTGALKPGMPADATIIPAN